MAQTRARSFAEAWINIAIGYTVNMLANFAIFPLMGWKITLAENLTIGVFYTVISLVRSYAIRRWMNRGDK